MEILKSPAKIAYTTRLPVKEGCHQLPSGVNPEQEVVVGVKFDLSDLTSEQGYVVTPMHEFFIRSMKRFNLSFSDAKALFPRYPNPLLMFLESGGSLILGAERKDGERSGTRYDREYKIRYDRVLTEDIRNYNFDKLETGELRLDSLLSRIKGRPLGEEIDFDLDGLLKIKMQAGQGRFMGGRDRYYVNLNIDINKLGIQSPLVRFLLGSKINKEIPGENTEDIIKISENIITTYLAHTASEV